MINPDFKTLLQEARDQERGRVLKDLETEVNRTSLTGFTKYTYRQWILETTRGKQ
jgi:hypothetical protein